jgi:phosphate acyltransferase
MMDIKNTENRRVIIAVDAMSGDNAPGSEVLGSILAAKERPNSLEVILVGKEKQISEILRKNDGELDNISVQNADDVITMKDSPSDVYKTKQDSSLIVAMNLQKEKKADALISAGNTGAVLACSTLKFGRIKGVSRPTIGSILPTEIGKTMVFDVGATVDCRPNNLYEYALMGSIYMSCMYKIDKPSVGLLSVGEEKTKGNELTLEAYKLLENSKLNFIGNIEGNDILKGKTDVVVCDGFIGNIVLKFAESVLNILKFRFKKYAEIGFFQKIWIGMFYNTLKKVIQDFDYQQYGGVPLLGINGVSIIGHGKSTPLAIKNMIFRAEETVRADINKKIEKLINNIIT